MKIEKIKFKNCIDEEFDIIYNVELQLFIDCILENEVYKPKIKEINDTIK